MKILKKRYMLLILAIGGAILTTITAIVQHLDKIEAENKTKEQQIALETANKKIINLQTQALDSIQIVSNLQDKLISEQGNLLTQNKRVQELQDKLFLEQTGGDALPTLSPSIYQGERINQIGFDIFNSSNYALPDLTVTFTDNSYLSYIGKIPVEEREKIIKAATHSTFLGTISKNSAASDFIRFEIDANISEIHYNVNMSWRNGILSGRIIFTRDKNGTFKTAGFTKW